jgi:hypothetical protein
VKLHTLLLIKNYLAENTKKNEKGAGDGTYREGEKCI